MTRLDYEQNRRVVYSPVCLICRHYQGNRWDDELRAHVGVCAAYPDEIPLPIWNGDNLHREPYPGDNGIRFEPIEPPRQ
jgi:hypothetical protein